MTWPKPTDAPTAIAAAFDFWMEHGELFDFLKPQWERLDNPNGAAGKPEAALTSGEKANPT